MAETIVILTEIKIIDVEQGCVESPVYLKWLNTQGGYSSWLFGKRQTKVINVSIDGEYTANTEDLENSIGGDEYMGSISAPAMILGADLPASKMDGIQGMLQSPKVLMLMNPDTWQVEAPVWQRVRIQRGSFITLYTDETRKGIEFTIFTPKINVQAE